MVDLIYSDSEVAYHMEYLNELETILVQAVHLTIN